MSKLILLKKQNLEQTNTPFIFAALVKKYVPAKAKNLGRELGLLETGKIANRFVLNAEPPESVRKIRQVKFVVKDGRMYDTARLWVSNNFKP